MNKRERHLPTESLASRVLEFDESQFDKQTALLRLKVANAQGVSGNVKELFASVQPHALIWDNKPIGKYLEVLRTGVGEQDRQIEPAQIKPLLNALNGRAVPNLTLLNNSDEFAYPHHITVFFDDYPNIVMVIRGEETGTLREQISRDLDALRNREPAPKGGQSTVDEILNAPNTKISKIEIKPLFAGGKKDSGLNLVLAGYLAEALLPSMEEEIGRQLLNSLMERI